MRQNIPFALIEMWHIHTSKYTLFIVKICYFRVVKSHFIIQNVSLSWINYAIFIVKICPIPVSNVVVVLEQQDLLPLYSDDKVWVSGIKPIWWY